MLMEDAAHKAFEDIARDLLFDPLGLGSTFFAAPGSMARFENRMAAGYDDKGLPIPGKFPPVPDLAASGMWSTPKELLAIGKEFVNAFHGESSILQAGTVRMMTIPEKDFPWACPGVFTEGEDILTSKGWGENGQCMLKMNCRTGEISVVMTNRNPGADQASSGVEWLVNRIFAVW